MFELCIFTAARLITHRIWRLAPKDTLCMKIWKEYMLVTAQSIGKILLDNMIVFLEAMYNEKML